MAKAKKKAPGKAKALAKKLAVKVQKVVQKALAKKPAAKAKAPAKPAPAKAAAKAKAAPAKAAPVAKKLAPAAKKPASKASNGKSASPLPALSRLSAGDAAPRFSLPDQNGNVVASDSLEGKSYIIYFYPKDDTPGCTREACGFRDDLGKFQSRGVEVIGVSPDGAASHTRFIDKYGLNFTLLSDEDKTLANAYGVWTKKQNYGREYMGIERSTFLVGADGNIKKVWRSVKVDGHIPAVYEATA
jgi:peroxiredoxin Q/BCP